MQKLLHLGAAFLRDSPKGMSLTYRFPGTFPWVQGLPGKHTCGMGSPSKPASIRTGLGVERAESANEPTSNTIPNATTLTFFMSSTLVSAGCGCPKDSP